MTRGLIDRLLFLYYICSTYIRHGVSMTGQYLQYPLDQEEHVDASHDGGQLQMVGVLEGAALIT